MPFWLLSCEGRDDKRGVLVRWSEHRIHVGLIRSVGIRVAAHVGGSHAREVDPIQGSAKKAARRKERESRRKREAEKERGAARKRSASRKRNPSRKEVEQKRKQALRRGETRQSLGEEPEKASSEHAFAKWRTECEGVVEAFQKR